MKKVTYEVILKRHKLVGKEKTEEQVQKEVQKEADMCYWESTDGCTTRVLSIEDIDYE